MYNNDNIISLDFKSPRDYLKEIAQKVKQRRLELNLTQEGLARRAGLKLPTYRKFEQTGEISLKSLISIAWVMDNLDDFNDLFSTRKYETFEDAISSNTITRKRGKKK